MSDEGATRSVTDGELSEAARSVLVTELNDLAGAWGSPGAVQHAAQHLSGAATVDVAHDFSVTLGLLLGDLAEVIAADSTRQAHRGAQSCAPGDSQEGRA